MLGIGPGNSGETPGVGGAVVALADGGTEGDSEPTFGNDPDACANAAFTSAEFTRTSLSTSPFVLGCSRRLSFSWNDCAFKAAAAGGTGVVIGDGLRSTSTSVNIEIAKVAKLMIRWSFRRHLRPLYGMHIRSGVLDHGGEGTCERHNEVLDWQI